LAEHYWARGNGVSHNQTLMDLTGEPFNAKYLADYCNRTVDEAWAMACAQMTGAAERVYPAATHADLDAQIRIVHGAELIADNGESDATMCRQFEAWVAERFPTPIQ
jgi:hypothetical protein